MNRIELETQCLQEIKQLPVDKLVEVIDFVQFLHSKSTKTQPRPLGLLQGKLKVQFAEDFKMTDEELLNS